MHHRLFIDYINDHYDELCRRYRQFCREKDYQWDEDVFQDTIIKCYNAIEKRGYLNDPTPQGIENFFFISFKINLKRDKQYARHLKRDWNVSSDDVYSMYEAWYNANNTSERNKLVGDLYKDFATLYIMMAVEQNFDSEHFHLFKLKTLCNYTYRQLCEKTGIRGCRQKVVDVKNWLKENITKDMINKSFQEIYGDIL